MSTVLSPITAVRVQAQAAIDASTRPRRHYQRSNQNSQSMIGYRPTYGGSPRRHPANGGCRKRETLGEETTLAWTH